MKNTESLLIERLPKAIAKRFVALCEPFELMLSAELSVRGSQLSHAYFPRSGFISLVIDIDSHPPLEVGMVGRESMLGTELVLGVAKTPWRAVVQGASVFTRSAPAGTLAAHEPGPRRVRPISCRARAEANRGPPRFPAAQGLRGGNFISACSAARVQPRS